MSNIFKIKIIRPKYDLDEYGEFLDQGKPVDILSPSCEDYPVIKDINPIIALNSGNIASFSGTTIKDNVVLSCTHGIRDLECPKKPATDYITYITKKGNYKISFIISYQNFFNSPELQIALSFDFSLYLIYSYDMNNWLKYYGDIHESKSILGYPRIEESGQIKQSEYLCKRTYSNVTDIRLEKCGFFDIPHYWPYPCFGQIAFDTGAIDGMSGGPILNNVGEIIAINGAEYGGKYINPLLVTEEEGNELSDDNDLIGFRYLKMISEFLKSTIGGYEYINYNPKIYFEHKDQAKKRWEDFLEKYESHPTNTQVKKFNGYYQNIYTLLFNQQYLYKKTVEEYDGNEDYEYELVVLKEKQWDIIGNSKVITGKLEKVFEEFFNYVTQFQEFNDEFFVNTYLDTICFVTFTNEGAEHTGPIYPSFDVFEFKTNRCYALFIGNENECECDDKKYNKYYDEICIVNPIKEHICV